MRPGEKRVSFGAAGLALAVVLALATAGSAAAQTESAATPGPDAGLTTTFVAPPAIGGDAPAAQTTETGGAGPRMDIYGFAQLDAGYDFKQVDPNWFDVLRPTKLPSFDKQFGDNGNYYASVRQSRLGVKGYLPTGLGEVKTIFEFELFGTGVDAGQTTFRLRHAWGEIGQFGAGQTWSPFMDPDVFPNQLEYWGPNGMVFFRNVQVRWMPMNGDTQLWFALERPGASADGGVYADRIALQGIKGHFPAPDVSWRFRKTGEWGHVQLSGIFRYISWTDTVKDNIDASGNKTGWGVNLSTNIKTPMKGTVRASLVYGDAIENYMNDAPVDIAAELNPGNPSRPITGKALPIFGLVAFYDFNWNEKFTSCFGYSRVDIDTSDGQTPDAFRKGQYALANVLYYPVKNVMTGLEFQWGERQNKSDGFKADDYRIQFSAKFNFDFHLGS